MIFLLELLLILLGANKPSRSSYVPGYRKRNGKYVRGHWKR